MVDPFQMALAALHASAGSVAAIFTPAGGAPTEINIIRDQQTREVGFGGGAVLMETNRVQIMRADAPQVRDGDALSVGNARLHADVTEWTEFAIQGGCSLDVEGVTWNCNLQPA